MECSNCHKVNAEGTRFCIYCGSLLQPSAAAQAAVPGAGPAGGTEQQVQTLTEEVRRLTEVVRRMDARLTGLEQGSAARLSPPAPSHVPPGTPAVGQIAERRPDTAAPPVPATAAASAPAKRQGMEWEQILGGNWLARVGVIALVFGAAFFLKLSFDNDWFGPVGRIILGILEGLCVLALAHYWRNQYPVFAQTLSGGGIAFLYLSINASFAADRLIGFYVALALLLVVSAASVFLALRAESMGLAVIGAVGAFASPFLLGAFRGGADAVRPGGSLELLIYVVVVGLGVAALSAFRCWRWFTLLALIGSLVFFMAWMSAFKGGLSLFEQEGALTLIFLIYVGATTLHQLISRQTPGPFDRSLMAVNAFSYFGFSHLILWDDRRSWLGVFSLLLALFYLGLGHVAQKRVTGKGGLNAFALSLAVVFLTIAVPVQISNNAWVTMAWAAEGTVLVWLSFFLKMGRFRLYSYIVFAGVAFRLFFVDTAVYRVAYYQSAYLPVLNERMMTFAFAVLTMYVAAHLLWKGAEDLTAGERRNSLAPRVFRLAASFFTLWVLSAEIITYFGTQLDAMSPADRAGAMGKTLKNSLNLSLTGLWAVYAVSALVVGINRRWRAVRLWALGLLIVPIGKVFVYDALTLEPVYRIIAFAGLGLLLVSSGYLYQRYRRAIKGLLTEKPEPSPPLP